MTPDPLYKPTSLRPPAYQLRYTWTGWATEGTFPPEPDASFFSTLADRWEEDDIRPLEWAWSPERIQFTTSVTPRVAPTTFASRMKGRLQHALRERGDSVDFSRKLAVGTIGETSYDRVESYILEQVEREALADPAFADTLEAYTESRDSVDLSKPTHTQSGRYWYNLHLVLVVRDRYRIGDEASWKQMYEACLEIADKKEHRMSSLSVMPDHVHMALRGDIETSPSEIALCYMNNLAYVQGQMALWEPSYYVGTFGEYDMDAVRF